MYWSEGPDPPMLLLYCFTVLRHSSGDFIVAKFSLHGTEEILLISPTLLPINAAALLSIYLKQMILSQL